MGAAEITQFLSALAVQRNVAASTQRSCPGRWRASTRTPATPGAGSGVFPGTRLYLNRDTGQRRRHHLHESVLQGAVKMAMRQAGLAKHASCHSFRHSFATHLPEDGHDIHAVQELLGTGTLARQ